MEEPDVSTIVVTYQSRDFIGPCLASIWGQGDEAGEVILVDNASTDATLEAAGGLDRTLTVMALGRNRGFAAAANLGAARARGRYLLFLNPDAEVLAGATATLTKHLEDHPAVAAAGPRFLSPAGAPEDSAFTYPSLLMTWLEFFPHPGRLLHSRVNGRLWSPDGRPIAVDHPLGACMMIRRSAWDDVGPFDEGFFLYCEEVDWCMRAKRRGWVISSVPSAMVAHHGGMSASAARADSLVHLYESRKRLHRKHRGRLFQAAAAFITRLGLAQERRRLLRRRGDSGALDPEAEGRLAGIERALRPSRREQA